MKGEIFINKLIIVGAGGHGRCCLDIARESFDQIVFLDDNHANEVINDCRVIGTIDEMSSYYLEYENIFIAIGNNKYRKELSIKAKEIGFNLVTLISSKSVVSKYVQIKEGTVVFPNAVINANAIIGKGCIVSTSAVIDHDAIINDYCHLNVSSIVPSMKQVPEFTKVDYGIVYRKVDDESWKKEYVKQFGNEPSFF